jgi:hypothetical protein
MFFEITAEEQEAFEQAVKADEAVAEAARLVRNQHDPWGTDKSEETLALGAAYEEAKAARDALKGNEKLALHQFKTEINSELAKHLPTGDMNAILTLAEETANNITGPTGLRVAALAKGLAILFFNTLSDQDVQDARAHITAARYKALLKAGIPSELVGQILVAEAGRPWSWPSAGGTMRSKG